MVSFTIHVFIPTVTAAQRRQSLLLMTLFILEEKKTPCFNANCEIKQTKDSMDSVVCIYLMSHCLE